MLGTKRLNIKNILFITLIVVSSLATGFSLVQSPKANADSISWTSSTDPALTVDESQARDPIDDKNCVEQNATLDGDTQPTPMCVVYRDNWRYALFSKTTGPWYDRFTERSFAVSVGSDTKMHRVSGLPGTLAPIAVTHNNDLIYKMPCAGCAWGGEVRIIKDLPSKLQRDSNYNLSRGYFYDDSQDVWVHEPGTNSHLRINRIDYSNNNKWLVMEQLGAGLVRLNLDTMEIKRFSTLAPEYGVANDPYMQMAISNDGQFVALGGKNVNFRAYKISTECGDDLTGEPFQACEEKPLYEYMNTQVGYYPEVFVPHFNDDGGELNMYIKPPYNTSNPPPPQWVTLKAPGYISQTLDYLALGDSYSSGEGDTEVTSSGQKHYLAHTDVEADYANGIPREKCHQSWRAYPFLLADQYNVDENKSETVACSGALIDDIAGNSAGDYEGQYDGKIGPRLKGLANMGTLQFDALEDFIPGRTRQIDFVKKYQPKAITVGVSGNNAKFGDVIKKCVAKIDVNDTCDYASDNQGIAELGKLIANQYDDLVTLYTRIHEASPVSKIYVVGYPKFVSTGSQCGQNVRLSTDERNMAEKSVEYFNNVIEKAAQRAGVEYIDIEDSLNGKRLCDTDKPYVTGIAFAGKSENQESFHPNHQGNELMATAIESDLGTDTMLTHRHCSIVLVDDFCPDTSVTAPEPTTYFASAMSGYNRSVKDEKLTSGVVDKTSSQNIQVKPFNLEPGSSVNIELHSTPVDLGDYTAEQDGSLSQNITIPSTVTAGYHTLHIYGDSFSGEPIDLTQIIEVQGPAGDIDEDGIADTVDPCLYVTPANVDADYDGIDDVCDPEITDPIIYEARNGDPNQSEDSTKLYLERNTLASSLTGIINDYTEPGSHWALVGTSQDSQTSATFNKLVILEDVQGKPLPTILAKNSNDQCIALQPEDYQSPALDPTDPSYVSRGLIKLNQLPEGESCD